MRWAHKTPESQEIAREIVEGFRKEHFGKYELVPIQDGWNYNFLLVDGTGPVAVLKLGGRKQVSTTRFCLDRYGEIGLPVPRVIGFQEIVPDTEYSIVVTGYVDHDNTPYDRREAGYILRRMHCVETDGVGELDPESGRGISENWHDFLIDWAVAPSRRGEVEEFLGGSLPNFIGDADCPESSLLHTDYHRGNILTKNGNIVAVIDPKGVIGDPLLDVAYAVLVGKAGEEFIGGYTGSDGLSQDELSRLEVYKRVIAVRKVEQALSQLDQQGLDPETKLFFESRRDSYKRFLTQS